jgi:hypothetical protein
VTFPPSNPVAIVIRTLLIGAALFAVYEASWISLFVAIVTFVLTFAPQMFEQYYQVRVPVSFTSAIIVFTYATLFLGEVGDFYERYWWWDVALHAGAAIGLGLMGFVFIFILFKGDKYAAPPWAMAWFAFCFALSLGVIWEYFEFGMDQIFGTNMQKSGLIDTMYDLIVDGFGAGLGALAGFFYLKGQKFGGLAALIDEFVRTNRRLFGKNKDR